MTTKPCADTKHAHYLPEYKPNDLFWAAGIEFEGYFETPWPFCADARFLTSKESHKRERYSVDYFQNYVDFGRNIQRYVDIFPRGHTFRLPVLANAYLLQHTDRAGEHRTLYKRGAPENPAFDGVTLFDIMKREDGWLREQYGRAYVFDGDTIEVATQGFYCSKVNDVVAELVRTKRLVETKVAKALGSDMQWCRANHGLAVMKSAQPARLAICNNMTYHLNLTLPTQLDERARVADEEAFVERHRKLIRLIQWIEPLLVAEYGTPDVLHTEGVSYDGLGAASQRVALSRYIGMGTYDTNAMPRGKLLNMAYDEHPYHRLPYWWYHSFYASNGGRTSGEAGYKRCEMIGFDVNFMKHTNHGVELRFFDWFPERRLYHLMYLLVFMMDHADSLEFVQNPVETRMWNEMACEVIRHGKKAEIPKTVRHAINVIFEGVECRKGDGPHEVLCKLYKVMEEKYRTRGTASQLFLGWMWERGLAEAEGAPSPSCLLKQWWRRL